jgi:hypothetical protein
MTRSGTDSEIVSFTYQVLIKIIKADQAKELVEEDKLKV